MTWFTNITDPRQILILLNVRCILQSNGIYELIWVNKLFLNIFEKNMKLLIVKYIFISLLVTSFY